LVSLVGERLPFLLQILSAPLILDSGYHLAQVRLGQTLNLLVQAILLLRSASPVAFGILGMRFHTEA